jgi:hypothetical protein
MLASNTGASNADHRTKLFCVQAGCVKAQNGQSAYWVTNCSHESETSKMVVKVLMPTLSTRTLEDGIETDNAKGACCLNQP